MEDLIKALRILAKYENPEYPTQCDHDVLYVLIDDKKVWKKNGYNDAKRKGQEIRKEKIKSYLYREYQRIKNKEN